MIKNWFLIKSESWTGKITHTLKGGGTEKEGGETNILRGVSWVKGRVLKKEGGLEPPYELWILIWYNLLWSGLVTQLLH